jgi:outer membrane protein assembly factor BamB
MKLTQFAIVLLGSALGLQGIAVYAADWPQYRGPNQDGIAPLGSSLVWPASGPKTVWKAPTQLGFSSFAIAGGKAYTLVNHAGKEACVALDAATGKALWCADADLAKYDGGGDAGGPKGDDGPRSTPTVDDGLVFVFTQGLKLYALNAATGKSVWHHDLIAEYRGKNIHWNNAASAVVDGNLVFAAGGGAGQTFVAFNKKTGALAWKSGSETITHSTPVVATLLGTRQVIFFVKSGLVAVAAADGKELWRFPFPFKVSTAISPVVCGDVVYCSAGYGVGGGACRIAKQGDKFTAQELWKIEGDKLVANHWSTPVFKNGYLYGMFSFKKFGTGPLKCVEVATGNIKWEQPGFGAGNIILVGDKVVALADNGEVVLVAAVPDAYKELGRIKAVTGKCWSTPAFSDGRLYVRSTKEGACLDVK